MIDRRDKEILVPQARGFVRGMFIVSKRGEPEEYSENLVVDEGLDYIIGSSMGLVAKNANWYIALYSNAVDPAANWAGTATPGVAFATTAGEWTAYDEGARPQWNEAALVAGSAALDSFSSKATFTCSTDGQTVVGAALISREAWGVGGTLIAASRFPSAKSLDAGEILDVGYGLTLAAVP